MKVKNIKLIIGIVLVVIVVAITITNNMENKKVITTSGATTEVSNKKIGWGIKRKNNNEQPDMGETNKKLIEENEGIAMGNTEKKVVYLTFDEGYEAGYTERILDILKKNKVKAAFFITGHYFNSKPDLVNRMINEGHIVGNHSASTIMSVN